LYGVPVSKDPEFCADFKNMHISCAGSTTLLYKIVTYVVRVCHVEGCGQRVTRFQKFKGTVA